MVKAAFFDLDGTVRSYNTQLVYPGTVRAIERLHSVGVKTFVATGRPPMILPEMPVSFDGYITMTGAYVFCGDKVLVSRPLPKDDARRWFAFAREHHICTMSFTDKQIFANYFDDKAKSLNKQLNFDMPPLLSEEEMAEQNNYQIIALVECEMDASLRQLMPNCFIPRWHPAFCDIVSSENSKSKAVMAVCEYLGIDISETMAFGDGGNDIDMLRKCGIGVAMGNAAAAVKAAADYVTTSVEDNGIEHAVEALWQRIVK